MALEVERILAAVAIVVVGAFLANLAFRRYHVPDVLLLIGLGVLLGPGTDLLDVSMFRAMAPVVATIAILVILFDGGLEIRLADLRAGATAGALMGAAVFGLTAVACAAVGWGLGLAPHLALLLGLVLGGAGVVIVVPLIRRLRVSERATTTVTIEAAFADVLVIVSVFAVSRAIASGSTDGGMIVGAMAVALAVAVAVGLSAGFIWARLLGAGWLRGYEYVLTLSALFLTHLLVEAASGSGPMAVLAFGLVIGNSHRSRRFAEASTLAGTRGQDVPVFGESLVGFHQEVVFLVRALVFVGLGATLDLAVFQSRAFLATGAALTMAVVLARAAGTWAVLRPRNFPAWDRLAVGLMFHRGIAAAALSQVPHQVFAIQGSELLPSYTAVVIILTNVVGSVLVGAASLGWVRRRLEDPGRAVRPVD